MGFLWATEIIQKLFVEEEDKEDWYVHMNISLSIVITIVLNIVKDQIYEK